MNTEEIMKAEELGRKIDTMMSLAAASIFLVIIGLFILLA